MHQRYLISCGYKKPRTTISIYLGQLQQTYSFISYIFIFIIAIMFIHSLVHPSTYLSIHSLNKYLLPTYYDQALLLFRVPRKHSTTRQHFTWQI